MLRRKLEPTLCNMRVYDDVARERGFILYIYNDNIMSYVIIYIPRRGTINY